MKKILSVSNLKIIIYILLLNQVSFLEKMKLIHNKINPSLNHLLKIISESSDYEEKNKCVQCLYSIFKSFYGDSLLPQGFIDTINTIKEKETTMKIKFKLMDILERKW